MKNSAYEHFSQSTFQPMNFSVYEYFSQWTLSQWNIQPENISANELFTQLTFQPILIFLNVNACITMQTTSLIYWNRKKYSFYFLVLRLVAWWNVYESPVTSPGQLEPWNDISKKEFRRPECSVKVSCFITNFY